jgi:hypothetical protein
LEPAEGVCITILDFPKQEESMKIVRLVLLSFLIVLCSAALFSMKNIAPAPDAGTKVLLYFALGYGVLASFVMFISEGFRPISESSGQKPAKKHDLVKEYWTNPFPVDTDFPDLRDGWRN